MHAFKRLLCALTVILLLVTAIPLAVHGEEISPIEESDFTILWTSDPQWYSFKYQNILIDQNDWVVENYERMNISYIIHTGDFVDLPHNREQWDFIDKQYKKWDDAGLEYGVLAGNHDIDGSNYTEFKEYFGTHRFEDNKTFGEAYDGNRGHYDLLSENGIDFIFVYLGYGTHSEADYEWMNSVLSEHSDKIAFLMFHEYLNADGTKTAIGNKIFERVVLKNPNVRAVLCGHNYNSARLVEFIDDDGDGKEDRTVYQLMANYQNTPNGGNGFMRFLEFDIDSGVIFQRTYSPYLKTFNFFESRGDDADEFGYRDEFAIPFDFSKPSAKGNGTGKTVSKPTVTIGSTTIDLNYVNTYEDSEGYNNAGAYDFYYSPDARDALKAKDGVYYITADFEDRIGYTVLGIYDSGEKTVPVPQNGRVIVLAKDATDTAGNKLDISKIKQGDGIVFSRTEGLAPTKAGTQINLYIRGYAGGLSIDGYNRAPASDEWVIFDKSYGESTKQGGFDGKGSALISFTPSESGDRYIATAVSAELESEKDIKIAENGFVLAINADSASDRFKSTLKSLFIEGIQAVLAGYKPESGLVYRGESIVSKSKSDWILSSQTFIFEEAEGAIILSNTDDLWPDARYTPKEPIKFKPESSSIIYDFDMEKSSQTSVVIHFTSGGYVKLNSYFEGATVSSGSGDVKGMGDTLNGSIDLSKVELPSGCIDSEGYATIKSIQIYASGSPNKKMTVREFRLIDGSEPDFVLPEDFIGADIHEGIISETSEEVQSEADITAPDGKADYTAFIVIVCGVIIIGSAVIILVTLKKRK